MGRKLGRNERERQTEESREKKKGQEKKIEGSIPKGGERTRKAAGRRKRGSACAKEREEIRLGWRTRDRNAGRGEGTGKVKKMERRGQREGK